MPTTQPGAGLAIVGTGRKNLSQPLGSIPCPRSGSDDGRSSGLGPLPRRATRAQSVIQIERSIFFLLSGAATTAADVSRGRPQRRGCLGLSLPVHRRPILSGGIESRPSAQPHRLDGCGLREQTTVRYRAKRRGFPEPTMIRTGQLLMILLLASPLAAGGWPVMAAACPDAHQGCAMMATHAPCGGSQWTAAETCCSSQAPMPQPPANVARPEPALSAHPSAPLPPDRSPAEARLPDSAPTLHSARPPLFLLYADLLI